MSETFLRHLYGIFCSQHFALHAIHRSYIVLLGSKIRFTLCWFCHSFVHPKVVFSNFWNRIIDVFSLILVCFLSVFNYLTLGFFLESLIIQNICALKKKKIQYFGTLGIGIFEAHVYIVLTE